MGVVGVFGAVGERDIRITVAGENDLNAPGVGKSRRDTLGDVESDAGFGEPRGADGAGVASAVAGVDHHTAVTSVHRRRCESVLRERR